jgi:hypothetical protein
MENTYTAYTKVIENKTYYFVKKFLTFPEFKDVPPMQEAFGMHTDFNKACEIAGIQDLKIREQLLEEVNGTVQQAKVIELNTIIFGGKSASL